MLSALLDQLFPCSIACLPNWWSRVTAVAPVTGLSVTVHYSPSVQPKWPHCHVGKNRGVLAVANSLNLHVFTGRRGERGE